LGSTIPFPLAQFYTVAMTTDDNQTITLPAPNNTTLLGATLTFKRITNTYQFTIAAASGLTPFIPCDNVAPQLNIVVDPTQYQVTLVCDGTHWDAINVL
jgi:hypothetical protein